MEEYLKSLEYIRNAILQSLLLREKCVLETLLKKNEAEINEGAAKALLLVFGIVSIICAFCWVGIFDIMTEMTVILLAVSLVTLVIPAFVILKMHIYKKMMKYLIVVSAAVMASTAYVLFTFQAVLVFVVPTVIAVLYLDKRLIYFSGIITALIIFMSHVISAVVQYQPWLEPFHGTGQIIRYGAIPRFLQYAGCFVLLVFISERYLRYLSQIADKTAETENTDEEKQEFEELLLMLSEREKSVFMLMIGGFTNMQIADNLCLSNGTVKNYVSTIYDKLGTRERNVLILKYSRFYKENDRGHTKL